MHVGYIYLITCHVTNHRYIGITTEVSKRWQQHRKAEGGCPALHAAIRRYGADNFRYEVLEKLTAPTREALRDALLDRECALIDAHDTYYPDGYNLVS